MYAISLHQPWASLIACGAKPFETRSWSPPAWLIGQRIAIHAAKKPIDADDREWARCCGAVDLPLGAIVCTALLERAYLCHGKAPPGYPTDEFGDYSEGRWAWLLTGVTPLPTPLPARGKQGFWKVGDFADA